MTNKFLQALDKLEPSSSKQVAVERHKLGAPHHGAVAFEADVLRSNEKQLPIAPEDIRETLEASYPIDATCWSNATDEVRDLCRYARNALGLDEEYAVDFRRLKTPSTWNLVGIDAIINFYKQMPDEMKVKFVNEYKSLMGFE